MRKRWRSSRSCRCFRTICACSCSSGSQLVRTSLATQALAKVENALGVGFGVAGSGNEKAMDLVTNGFSNHPPVHYYEAGDAPALPPVLQGAITAEILGPSPKASEGDFAASDNKTEQYLAAVSVRGLTDTTSFRPFDLDWPASASDYPADAFRPWPGFREMEKALHAVQPDALAAAADLVDGTLNNQSLVVLFTCRGKKLLFVGDAQWGNWAYWLYGRGVKGKDPGISAARARNPRQHRLLQGGPPRQHQRDADSGSGCDVRHVRRDVLDRNRLSQRQAYLWKHQEEDRGAADCADGSAGRADG